MRTVRLIVAYDGTEFSGFQRQRGVRTVQEELEIAASRMACERVIIRGAGRTDAGVHARCQVAAFRTEADISDRGWRLGMTGMLPRSIVVTDARYVQDNFDPRTASSGKRYRYSLLVGPDRDPLLRHCLWHIYDGFDVDRMEREAASFVGTHDFAAFRAADCERKTTVRTVFRVAVTRTAERPDIVHIDVEGTAFLKNMVRVMAGTLVDVGRGKLEPGVVAARIADRDRTRSGMTAPPHGLSLEQVYLREAWRVPDDPLPLVPPYAAPFLEPPVEAP